MVLIPILIGFFTGLVLGVFGSGGGIVTTPALIYLLHIPVKSSIAMSLGIIAITGIVAVIQYWRRGHVNLKIAILFSLFSMSGSYLGSYLGLFTPPWVQLITFSVVMYIAAWKLLSRDKGRPAKSTDLETNQLKSVVIWVLRMGIVGLLVGILAGLIGVGGGFMIVPALVLLSGMPMKEAIGTALIIVTLNSIAGFAGYLGHVYINYALVGEFAIVAFFGSLLGSYITHRLSPNHLKIAFGIFLLFAATGILLKTLL